MFLNVLAFDAYVLYRPIKQHPAYQTAKDLASRYSSTLFDKTIPQYKGE